MNEDRTLVARVVPAGLLGLAAAVVALALAVLILVAFGITVLVAAGMIGAAAAVVILDLLRRRPVRRD